MTYQQSDIERARAGAFSEAADTMCNQWNLLKRTEAWCRMGSDFQDIWKNLKDISDDYHKSANQMEEKQAAKNRWCPKCGLSRARPEGDGYVACECKQKNQKVENTND